MPTTKYNSPKKAPLPKWSKDSKNYGGATQEGVYAPGVSSDVLRNPDNPPVKMRGKGAAERGFTANGPMG